MKVYKDFYFKTVMTSINFLYKVFGVYIPVSMGGTRYSGPIGGQLVIAEYVFGEGEGQKALDLAREDEIDVASVTTESTNRPLTRR